MTVSGMLSHGTIIEVNFVALALKVMASVLKFVQQQHTQQID